MSPTRRVSGAVAVVTVMAVAAVLTGCTEQAPPPSDTSTPRPLEKSLFTTDDEALAAASEGYTQYLKVLDEVSETDQDLSRLLEVATPEYADEVIESVENLRADGLHTEGKSTFEAMRVFERWRDEGVEYVSTYVCFDSSQVRVVDANGADVTPPERVDRRSVVVRFQSADDDVRRMIPRGADSWWRDELCP